MTDAHFMRLALRLARRGYGTTSQDLMVGAYFMVSFTLITSSFSGY